MTSEANVSMASREAKKARRQKLEVLPRTKLSLTEKVSLLCPLKFIDLYARGIKYIPEIKFLYLDLDACWGFPEWYIGVRYFNGII